eukprot:543532-Prorocentrum_minimum.AAC.1
MADCDPITRKARPHQWLYFGELQHFCRRKEQVNLVTESFEFTKKHVTMTVPDAPLAADLLEAANVAYRSEFAGSWMRGR